MRLRFNITTLYIQCAPIQTGRIKINIPNVSIKGYRLICQQEKISTIDTQYANERNNVYNRKK